MRTTIATAVMLLALAPGRFARAEERGELQRLAAGHAQKARESAQECDRLVDEGTEAKWANARDRFLEQLAASVAEIEEASAARNEDDAAILAVADAHQALSRTNLVYAMRTARARNDPSPVVRRRALAELRGAHLAWYLLQLPSTHDFEREQRSDRADLVRSAKIAVSADHIGGLLKYFIADGAGISKPWPPYSGKAFILWLVAANKLDRRDDHQLAILFSPGDATRSLDLLGGAREFATITKESLRDGTDLGRFTSYVARRNGDKEHLITSDVMMSGGPVIADLSFPDVAIVGYVSGAVKVLTRPELGLGPDRPIEVGEESWAEILRSFEPERPARLDEAVALAKSQMALIATTIDAFRALRKSLPKTLDELEGADPKTGEPYLREVPRDPWGQDFEYRVLTLCAYDITSPGPDRVPSTDDDIRHTSPEPPK